MADDEHRENDQEPAEVFQHVGDTEVRRKTWWRRFGGDGFLISLGVHVILALVAIFWVVTTWVDKKSDGDPDVFATGAGGGTQGDRAKIFEHRIKPRNARNMVSTPTKIVAKGSSSLSLPEMPNVSMSAMLSGNLTGGSSKGLGGGSGGGIGTGQGVGRGGGRNMVSIFGASGFGANTGLIGTFYDLKQTKSGGETGMAADGGDSTQQYVDKLREYVRRKFRNEVLDEYYQGPEKLAATQIYIPGRPAGKAPEAFQARNVRPSRWLVHYSGAVKAPKSGEIRFVGYADDIIYVNWNGTHALDGGHDLLTEDYRGTGHFVSRNRAPRAGQRPSEGDINRWGTPGEGGIRVGPWQKVERGRTYNMDVLIGETPGGSFACYLLFEERDPTTLRGKGQLGLFRIGNQPLPDEIANGGGGISADMSGAGWIWEPVIRRIR